MNLIKIHPDYMYTPIKITESAFDKIEELLKSETQDSCFYICVQGGGCSGFMYNFDIKESSKINNCEEQIVITKNDGKLLIVIDKVSLQYINGSTLDYRRQLISTGFVIVENPNSTSKCGCGSSFSVF